MVPPVIVSLMTPICGCAPPNTIALPLGSRLPIVPGPVNVLPASSEVHRNVG